MPPSRSKAPVARNSAPVKNDVATSAAKELLSLVRRVREITLPRLLEGAPDMAAAGDLVRQFADLCAKILPAVSAIQGAVDHLRDQSAHAWILEEAGKSLRLIAIGIECQVTPTGPEAFSAADIHAMVDGGRLPPAGKNFAPEQFAPIFEALKTSPIEVNRWDEVGRQLEQEARSAEKRGYATPPPSANDPQHSSDFCSVRWYGETYTFTERQAVAVRVLWEAWEQGTPCVRDETILETIDHASPPKRLSGIFRSSDRKGAHPAWGTMIVEGKVKGSRQLSSSAASTAPKKSSKITKRHT